MPLTQLPIANGFYRTDSLPISAQNCVNVFPVVEEAPSLVQESLRGCPGATQTQAAVDAECRGSHTLDGVPYMVIGDTLYSLDSDGATTAISGTIAGTGPVSMAENGTQLCILVPGSTGYIYTTSGGLVEISDGDFDANGNPTAVVFLDGYFVFTTDTKKIIVSALNNGLAYDALDFGSAESSPDDVIAPVVLFNQLFIAGTSTFEAYSNVGGSGFPFQRSNLFLQQGVSARFSIQNTPDTFTWVGSGKNQQPSVWVVEGNQTRKISTRGIDRLLRDLTADQLAAITSWSYGQDGHFFVGWNLPTTTIVYDFYTSRWHERKSRILQSVNDYDITTSRLVNHIVAYGKVFVGDSEDGRVGELSMEALDEYGDEILREWTPQPFQNNLQPFSVPYMELHLESGVGGTSSPMVVMSRSTDGGRNFLTPRPRPFGAAGEYSRRAIWRRNGRPKTTDTYRFTITDRVKVSAIQLIADIQP